MNLLSSSLIAICSLLSAYPQLQYSWPETFQAGEDLLFDTLDLRLSGPCYDVAFFQNEIIFLRPGEETTFLTEMNRPGLETSRPLFSNKEFSCSPAAFSFPENKSNGYYSKKIVLVDQPSVEKIYEMSIANGEASDIKEISFAADSFRYLHPAVSTDGSIMVFSSDRLPTRGGLDLFVSRLTASGWSEPLQLGEFINTSGHDWYPFLDGQNNLWFSSSGHSGYGGYDMYVCSFDGKDWEHPRNLGSTMNGPQDELGISIHPANQVALFSRTKTRGSEGLALMVSLKENASSEKISAHLQDMADPATHAISGIQVAREEKPEAEIKKETETLPESRIIPEPEPEPSVPTDPNKVIFRVQIISSLNPRSFPTVLIEGKSYATHEYLYKGSYRITVGAFNSLDDANAFRLKCLNSGFTQAFVAAFRGSQRETDPSVFKQ